MPWPWLWLTDKKEKDKKDKEPQPSPQPQDENSFLQKDQPGNKKTFDPLEFLGNAPYRG